MRLVVALALLALAACATESGFKKIANSFLNRPEQQLIAAWGPPDQVYESEGLKYLTYLDSRSTTLPGTAPTYTTTFVGNTAYTTSYGGTPARTYALNCKVTFTVVNTLVVNWRYEGNNCRA